MAEWSIAAVLKTVEGHTSGGSNPSLSAEKATSLRLLFLLERRDENPRFVIAKRLRSAAEKESLSFRRKSSLNEVAFFVGITSIHIHNKAVEHNVIKMADYAINQL